MIDFARDIADNGAQDDTMATVERVVQDLLEEVLHVHGHAQIDDGLLGGHLTAFSMKPGRMLGIWASIASPPRRRACQGEQSGHRGEKDARGELLRQWLPNRRHRVGVRGRPVLCPVQRQGNS